MVVGNTKIYLFLVIGFTNYQIIVLNSLIDNGKAS